MLFAIHCLDKPGAEALRHAVQDAHAAYMRAQAGRIVFGGPLLADDGATRVGTLVVVDLPSRAELDAFLDAEPYRRAGLFDRCEVHPCQRVVQDGQFAPLS